MFDNIMLRTTRPTELRRLRQLEKPGGLAIVTGRRRIGKTRLLLDWVAATGGIYFIADQSSPEIQRRYLADAIAERLPGFADVEYPDWRALFTRLAADAAAAKLRVPLVLDEVPYLLAGAPELPSVLAQLVDRAKFPIALAGSDRELLGALALDAEAPLRAHLALALELTPLGPHELLAGRTKISASVQLDRYTAWGGTPRYRTLADAQRGSVADAVDSLVLDRAGVLHEDPLHLLREEDATILRPLLDAIGSGRSRVHEIAAFAGRPPTSLSRALDRLRALGLVTREIPFGQDERDTKRTLYRLVDPFHRLWFRVVAPHRARLAHAAKKDRLALLAEHWPTLRAQTWTQLCLEHLARHKRSKAFGAWETPRPFWQGNAADWDLVSTTADRRLLLGATRGHVKTPTLAQLTAEAQGVAIKRAPELGPAYDAHTEERALFVPEAPPRCPKELHGVRIVTFAELLPAK